MGRREMEEEQKAELVKEICFISSAFASCEHLSSNARNRAFVDWYLILKKVDEDSDFDVIRRSYRQLALQLHPDKNKHPKAEVAFKLISEAYYCLSDKARRKCFNGERSSNFCKDCYLSWKSDHHEITSNTKVSISKNYKNNDDDANNNNKPKPRRQQSSRQNHILRRLKQVQNRFREECHVIESYLKSTMITTGRESPIFDPYDPSRFPNYPYRRQTMEATAMATGYCFFQPSADWGQVPCESPVYQIRSDCWTRRTSKPQSSKV
ncbi:uncharacterized protein LOC110104427 isoform X1 [Dendrobium catenatum]|uniref:uncharacterized protein LOC110104427 isoform X1 n=1 Tax=Dendrobium catenatum TaxID=906689 RepID=UPI00109F595F|nr:uncharacterized protein LOC110104427 isoform X1 [Dendrobium catenatum]